MLYGTATPPSKRYWLTPPDLYVKLDAEFHFDFDPCPHPVPEGFDGLTCEWGRSNYVNPPFGATISEGRRRGISAWVQKAVAEQAKGRRSVFIFPLDNCILALLAAVGSGVRNLGNVKFLAIEDGTPGGLHRPTAAFILTPQHQTT